MAKTKRRRPLKKLVETIRTVRANSLERRAGRLKKRAARVRSRGSSS
jgi:hypothetical protein